MVKIAYVINYIVKNGPSSVVLNIINNLDKTKYKVTLITLFDGNDADVVNKLRNNEVEVYECSSLNRMGCILGQSKEFDTIIMKKQFDILHTHGLIPDVLSSRLKLKVKKITTIHNNMYEDYLDSYGWMKSRIYIPLHLSALKKIDVCVGCSKSVYDVMKKYLDNVTYIRNGIEPIKKNMNITREELGISQKARVFLYAGVLSSRKNVVKLIEKFVQYHKEDEYLLVLGNGDKENECKQKADEHIKMLGFQENLGSYMQISDVYISFSLSEGFSISVLEALACGLGVFLSDIPSHREIVEMGKKIYLGEIFGENEFEKKIEILRSKYFEKKEIMKFQETNLSAKVMTKNYDNLYIKQM